MGRTALTEGIARIRAIQDAIGSDAGLMVDCHWRLTPGCAAHLVDELEELDVTWLEDPFPEECTAEWIADARKARRPMNEHHRNPGRFGVGVVRNAAATL